MTQEEKAKAYDEMVQRVKELHETGNFLTKKQMEIICPELAESEDERIRRCLCAIVKWLGFDSSFFIDNSVEKTSVLAYLEKQKYNRMQPIYDNQESFESALDKAWKSYNESGARTVDGCEDDYVECVHAKGFREGYLFGIGKQKENPKSSDSIPSDCMADVKIEDRNQKHNISVDEIAQDYVEGVKEYNPEPTWDLMQTAVCYGYHYCEMKEQKPDEIDGKALLHVSNKSYDIGFRDGVASVKPVEGEFPYNTPADTVEGEIENIWSKLSCENKFTATKTGFREVILHFVNYVRSNVAPEWNEEDRLILDSIIAVVEEWEDTQSDKEKAYYGATTKSDWLKSLRPQPHWKPSDDQMTRLNECVIEARERHSASTSGYERYRILNSLYTNLKKLM